MKIKGPEISIDDFVNREIVHCVSSLIWELAHADQPLKNYEDLGMEAFEVPDWESTFENWIADASRQEIKCLLDDLFEHFRPEMIKPNGARAEEQIVCKLVEQHDDYQRICEDMCLDIHYTEVFEHWAVSYFLAQKLEEKGEKILRDVFDFRFVWCRTTTGQMISADWVIESIYDDMFNS